MKSITAPELRSMICDGGELALLDVREELPYSESHLLHARSLPLSRLELRLAALVPRRTTRIVLCDGGEGLAAARRRTVARFGYGDVAVLEGGIAAGRRRASSSSPASTCRARRSANSSSIRATRPASPPEELHALMARGTNMVVLDSRPYRRIPPRLDPDGIDTPGAELVLRARDIAPDPATLVVVNCAGRTRSIIGAQSLINAGLPNKVVALRNGTMGWSLAGFSPITARSAARPCPRPPSLAWAQAAAAKVARRFGVERTDVATARALAGGRVAHDLSLRRARSGGVRGGASAGRACRRRAGSSSRRPTSMRDAQCAPGAGRSARGARADDGVVAKQMGWREVYVLPRRGARPAGPCRACSASTKPWRAASRPTRLPR